MPREVKPRVRLFHWRTAEGRAVAELLEKAGYEVLYPGDQQNGSFKMMLDGPTHAAVIDLTRLPSHGRYVAAEIRNRKSTRHIPIVFLDGAAEKIGKIRAEIPDAVYTTRAKLAAVLKKVKPAADPVTPPRMMESTRSTAGRASRRR